MIYSETKPKTEYGDWYLEGGKRKRIIVRWYECLLTPPGEPKAWIPMLDMEIKS